MLYDLSHKTCVPEYFEGRRWKVGLLQILNLEGRLHIMNEGAAVDVELASAHTFSSSTHDIYSRWGEFVSWAADLGDVPDEALTVNYREDDLGPVARPRQVFAVGLNYLDHAAEAGFVPPSEPMIFPKWPTSIAGPYVEVPLPGGEVDWEVELVVVIGRGGRNIPADNAWLHVAGITVGQDLSERARQLRGGFPQFGLAKSHQAFAPIGPVLVSLDEIPDPNDMAISCRLNGQTVQSARTSDMIFSIPELIAYLSSTVELMPGDVIFTGTPPGVGMGMNPQVFLQPGDILSSEIEGIGRMEQTFVAGYEMHTATSTADNNPNGGYAS